MIYSEKLLAFKNMLGESENIVFFGGAGVSTESGIKDYRSKDGIYRTVKDYGISPEVILSHDFFFANPEVFYDFYKKYFLDCSAKPNNAHYALSKLENVGKIRAVITQNIDGLHQEAGSKRVFEIHGTADKYYCTKCRKRFSRSYVQQCGSIVPFCDECGGLVRPDVTLYGEMLNSDIESMAIGALSEADMVIVGGTSLVVYPAAAYLRYFTGKYIVLINRDETPMDDKAQLVFRENIGKVLKDVTDD